MVDEQMLEEMYNNMLDECTPTVKIGTLEYMPSEVLKKLDPIAYRCGMNDYESSLREDYENGYGYEELFADEKGE